MFLVSHQDTREEIIAVMDNGEKKTDHFYTFIWAPNTQIEDMFINTVCFRSHDTLNGERFGLMQ